MAAAGSVANPVDLLGDAGPDVYATTIESVLADPSVDAAIAIHAPTLVADADAVAAAIAGVRTDKALVSVIVGRGRGLLVTDDDAGVPVFGAVEQAVAALGHAAAYGAWRARPEDEEPERDDIDQSTVMATIAKVVAGAPGGRWLSADETATVLEAYGIPVVGSAEVVNADEARAAARTLGYPVALKAQGPDLVHKSDVGGVLLNLGSARAVEQAWTHMKAALGPSMTHGLVQRMASPGVELIAGIVRDETFGPLVVFGIGGTIAELIGDRTVRVAPLSDAAADEAVHSVRCSPLLTGYRGSEPVDVEAVTDLLVRLGLLARDVPEIVELDLNPVIASPEQIVVVDARIRVRPAVPTGGHVRQLSPPRPDGG
jgi:acyl-CoA synthetase (NDP forming)